MTVAEIAARLGKRQLVLPAPVLSVALRIGRMLRLTPHGPEKVPFLRYRPVLSNRRLREEFGYAPTRTTAEAFEAYLTSHPGLAQSRIT